MFRVILGIEFLWIKTGLVQCNIDRGQSVHSPAGVLVTRWKHSLHESLYELRKAILHNALSHRAHQGELQTEMSD